MPRQYSDKEVEDLFLDIWWETSEETYNSIWQEGIEGEEMIDEMVKIYPKLYRSILNKLVERIG